MPATLDREKIRNHLQDFTLQALFVEELGWDHGGADLEVPVAATTFALQAVAHKRGMVVYQYRAGSAAAFPDQPTRQKIERVVTKAVHEHLIVYATHNNDTQVWQWVKRQPGQPARSRQHVHYQNHSGEALVQKLEQLVFTLDEEADLTIPDVVKRVRSAFDVEKVTKRFYERFRTELTAFGGFIDGITAQGDRDWYASLMLNRMMFVYFVQKQGFLADDPDYLRNRLQMVQQLPDHPEPVEGQGRFHQFYRLFLLRLFHEGLGQPESQRAPDLAALLGNVPFLNGGLFDVHDLERDNPDISIPDEAFERVFDFFEEYHWHLDERRHRDDNEINPDVLGYIFEKYVNQKQMGAYYTKEDITGYISRNTVIPFLFDAARRACPVAFGPDGGVWRLLRDDPDRYIYPAVGHGITWNARQAENPIRLAAPFDLPADVAAGIGDVSGRGGWNEPAPDAYALPTETWREVVARRQRYAEVRAKLAAGEVRAVNDLITLNLDVEQFAADVIAQSEGPELLRAFWKALKEISVLDPTCGSGAFLFAALNVLEPLYTACLEGMQGFLDDLERTERPHHPNALRDFRNVREQLDKHPGERYFILKSIVLNNLYGVDVMAEAVEICKLRLFLKLVAQLDRYEQIEPLPDIDFNVRAGNTLVGFTSLDAVREAMTVTPDGQHRALFDADRAALARIEAEAEIASRAFNQFREQQTMLGGEVTADDKADLRRRLQNLGGELDRLLATEYGVDPGKPAAYEAWRASHQPFHWFVEFYGIMRKGGFDVVIGNPPYVSTAKVPYTFSRGEVDGFPDIYGHVVLRSTKLTIRGGRCSMIVPLSITFSRDFGSLREILLDWGTGWFSSYDNIPAALFAGVSQRCTIWVGHNSGKRPFVAPMYRWRAANRPHLIGNVTYVPAEGLDVGRIGLPKLADPLHETVLTEVLLPTLAKHRSVIWNGRESRAQIGFSQTARNFVSVFRADPPCLDASSLRNLSPSIIGTLTCSTDEDAYASLAVLSGELFFWYWLVLGDGFHVTSWLVRDYVAVLDHIPSDNYSFLVELGRILDSERNKWLVFKKNAGRYVGNFNYRGAYQITRRADLLLLAGLSRGQNEALSVFEYVQRVLAINEHAGEKGIPPGVKRLFPVPQSGSRLDMATAARIDSFLAERLGFTDEELDFIINHDIKYRVGRDTDENTAKYCAING